MFKYIKKQITKYHNLKHAQSENVSNKLVIEKLKEKIDNLEKDKINPIALVNAIVNNGIEWYNYRGLPREQQVTYHAEAQSILETSVFKNEINSLINKWAIYCLRGSEDWRSIRDMRMQASALDLLRERLASIQHPGEIKEEEPLDPHSVFNN